MLMPLPEKQAGKLLSLLVEEGREYGDLVAQRLVELVRSEPLESRDELHRQLVVGAAPYLSHTAWHTRVAAASCLESLARVGCAGSQRHVGDKVGTEVKDQRAGRDGDALTDELSRGWVGLGEVRLPEVLEHGALLLSRGDNDAPTEQQQESSPSADVRARVGRERKRLLRCLGLAGGSGEARAGSLYSSIGDAIEDEDLQGASSKSSSAAASSTQKGKTKRRNRSGGAQNGADTPESLQPATRNPLGRKKRTAAQGANAASSPASGNLEATTEATADGPPLSSRQRNRLSRQVRSGARAASSLTAPAGKEGGDIGGKSSCVGGGGGHTGREDGPPAFLGRTGGMMDLAMDARGTLVSLAADLVAQLFHPVWQCRHGAALGALSILRAWNALRRRGEPVPYGNRMAAWAEDAVARCVCVLALDRFGDYSGRMVAPVRETAAQLLAVAALQLDTSRLRAAAELLVDLTAASEWQARHGGFCGMESLCAVAIGGDGKGIGASREASLFLRDLVNRTTARGLTDPAEDVCAAAARAVRLVMRRFLSLETPPSSGGETGIDTVEISKIDAERCSGGTGDGVEGGRHGSFERGGRRGGPGRSGHGRDVFDLVWKALEELDQDSSCVEDLADLLETCCEKVSGEVDPLSSGHRLERLLDLWGDGRARVRACAVRSLLALTRGVTRSVFKEPGTPLTSPSSSTKSGKVLRTADSVPAAKSVVVTGASERCEWMLRRCLKRMLCEREDDVRIQCARLWSELLKALYQIIQESCSAARYPLEAASQLVISLLVPGILRSNSPVDRPSLCLPLSAGRHSLSADDKHALYTTVATACLFILFTPPVDQTLPPSSKPVGASSTTASAGKIDRSASSCPPPKRARRRRYAVSSDAAAGAKSQQKEQQQDSGGEGEEEKVEDGRWEGVGASASYLGRLAAAEALAELVTASAAAGPPVSSEAAASLAATAEKYRRTRNASGRSHGKRSRRSVACGGDDGDSATARARMLDTPREVIMAESARRARSVWAWERELGFLLIESCAAGRAGEGNGDEDGSATGASSQDSAHGHLTASAWTAVDEALMGTKDGPSPPEAFFQELEGVNAGVTAACNSFILVRLQDAALVRDTSGNSIAGHSTTRGANGSSSETPTAREGIAGVEKRFQSLATAFGETLAPLDRGATWEQRETVWTERLRYFHARIQAQQAALGYRVSAAAASAYTLGRPLPSELNPILRPLVTAVKKEPDAQRRQRTASRLARVVSELLADDGPRRKERRDAGALVLFRLAVLTGSQPSLPVAASEEGSEGARSTDCLGAADTLKHAVARVCYQPAKPRSLLAESSAAVGVGGREDGKPVGDERSRGGGGSDGRTGVAADGVDMAWGSAGGVGAWAQQTLAPLLMGGGGLANGTGMVKAGDGDHAKDSAVVGMTEERTGLATTPARSRKLSAAERSMSPPEIRARELSAALAVADALLQAARSPVDGRAGPLSGLLLETPLAAGLLALARSASAAGLTADEELQQRVEGVSAAAAAAADSALIIAREAAATCPDGMWTGLRAEIFPALAKGPVGHGGSSSSRDGVLSNGVGGEKAGGVRTALVFREVIDGMGTGVVPFAARLLPVALRGMTDANEEVRGLLASTFNRLVKAVALAADEEEKHVEEVGQAVADACHAKGGRYMDAIRTDLGSSIEADGELIARHLVRGEPLPRLHRDLLPERLAGQAAKGISLRPYQWEGVAWLDFLRRIGVHGILADDMGLGKTLQALMAVAICHFTHPGRRSLVVCPSMLVHHWQAECSKYFGTDLLRPAAYAGPVSARRRLAARLGLTEGATTDPIDANVVVTSYSVLRTDAEVLSGEGWLYLVLDEAHILRNPATRIAKGARALRSSHRLGLTGTPIQNSVLELWSLFQFLMPGYLGDRRAFQRDVVRPVRAALSWDGNSRDTVKGLKELDKLHRQVLPFVLRRDKSEVLADLPPKIITEMLCDLTSEQRRLHDIWERGGEGSHVVAAVSQAERVRLSNERAAAAADGATQTVASIAVAESITDAAASSDVIDGVGEGAAASPRVDRAAGGDAPSSAARMAAAKTGRLSVGAQALASLSKLQLLCVHPALVTGKDSATNIGASTDIGLSGKLMALRELLWDAGIGERHAMKASDKNGGVHIDSDSNSCSSRSDSSGSDMEQDSSNSSDSDSADDHEDEQVNAQDDSSSSHRNDDVNGSDRAAQERGRADGAENMDTHRTGGAERSGGAAGNPGRTQDARLPGNASTKRGTLGPSFPRRGKTTTAARLPGCKCLIFAQHRAALDVTESALLRPWFPGVRFLRIDGSVGQDERAAAVDRFSTDPMVAVLLLTTRVGHLGLNLHAASMVVFLEHDWNPQVDLQAMDRAHRLGQRKAVNVYRLIAAESIEQRVLGLQGHKLGVAAAVVSRENASTFSNGTGEVLGLLGDAMGAAGTPTEGKDGRAGAAATENGLEIWSADEEYAYLAAERLADSVARE